MALEKLFDEIDVDNSGTISFREIMVFCKKRGLRLGYGEIVAFMKYFDQVEQHKLPFSIIWYSLTGFKAALRYSTQPTIPNT